MIIAGTDNSVWIDLGNEEPGHYEWVDVLYDGKPIKSPVNINSLPPGHYRLK